MKARVFLLSTLTLIIIFIILLNSCRHKNLVGENRKVQNENTISLAKETLASAHITKKEVTALRKAYYKDRRRLLTQDPAYPNDPSKKIVLEGLIFDAAQIRQIVDTNLSGATADQVILLFGLDSSKSEFHIVVLGSYNGTLLDYPQADPTSTTSTRTSVYDKADPYPPH